MSARHRRLSLRESSAVIRYFRGAEVEQLLDRLHCIGLRNVAVAVNRSIAQRDDHIGLAENRIARRLFERRLVD